MDKLTIDTSYDPAYEQWEIGKLSAMREIAFSIENQYPYYYMGRSKSLD
jgi:arginyl-tRNA--protein-N-Asp/Glu arginylyltransferase